MRHSCQSRHQSIATRGFTLVEVTVSSALMLVVLAFLCGAYLFLQRGFGEITQLANARASQKRVLDAVGVDLRNALVPLTNAPSGTNLMSAGLAKTLPLTLELPMRYSGYESKGHRTGDPGRFSTWVAGEAAISTTTGKAFYSAAQRLTVVYTKSGNSLLRTISGTGVPSATREIAVFPSGFDLTFDCVGKAITPKLSFTPFNTHRSSIGTATDTLISSSIYLRARYNQ